MGLKMKKRNRNPAKRDNNRENYPYKKAINTRYWLVKQLVVQHPRKQVAKFETFCEFLKLIFARFLLASQVS